MDVPEMKLVLSENQIAERVRILAEEVSADYAGKDLVLVGVLNGVFLFFADLAKRLTIPVWVDFIRLASYGGGTSSCGQIRMTKDVETDLNGKHVLIIEDIVDSGMTLSWLKSHLAGKGAASVKTCVLIDKHERREMDVSVEYAGFIIEHGFLVGYGLDYDGRFRCLPEIYHLVMT